jgi:hypothetical protein
MFFPLRLRFQVTKTGRPEKALSPIRTRPDTSRAVGTPVIEPVGILL